MVAQTAESAIGRKQNGSFDPDLAAHIVSGILRAKNPEEQLLSAISDGALPDQVGLELAEVLGEIVRVLNLDNSVEVVASLSNRGAISTLTEQALLLAIIEMAENEAGQTETGNEPAEVLSVEPNRRDALIMAATELQQQFGTALAIPANKLDKIRRQVENLPVEEFASLRQFLNSVILAQAELPANQRQVDVYASLEVVEILLRRRQRELTAAIFVAYETLFRQGFRLRDRDEANRPLVTITSTNLIRNRFRAWQDANESCLGEKEFAAAENAVRTLEKFLLAAAHESVREAIQKDLAARLRERIIKSGVQALDNINSELVAALPETKEEVIREAQVPLNNHIAKLASCLRTIGGKSLVEADGALDEILTGFSLCQFWRQEVAALEGSDYNPADQQPKLSPTEKRLAFLEVELKELEEIRIEIEEQIEKVTAHGSGATLKKLGILLSITLRKIGDLDRLIAPLRPQPAAQTSTRNVFQLPPTQVPTLAKETSHG